MCAKNMWGKLDDLEPIKTPTLILKEQGELLNGATKGTLRGITTLQTVGDEFLIGFDIKAFYLNQYQYTLLTVRHGLNVYPLTVKDKVQDKEYSCETEEAFVEAVEYILSSTEVRKIIQTLISQSRS